MHLRRKKSKTDLLKEQVSDLTDRAADLTGRAATTVAPRVESARDAAVGAAGHAYEAASTRVRDDYAPRVRDQYVPRVRDAAAPAVAAALAKAAALTPGVEPPQEKKGGKLKKLVLLLGLGGAVAFAVKKFSGGPATPPPRPAPVRTPAPTPTPPPDAGAEPTSSPQVDGESSSPSVSAPGH